MRSNRYSDEMAVVKTIYNTLFRRTSTFAVTIMVSAIFFERFFDQVGDGIFDYCNRGKLWKDIKDNYNKEPEA